MGEPARVTSSGAPLAAPPRTGVAAELRGAASSLTFLTRLPLGSALDLRGEDLARSAPYFPLVGAGIGAIDAVVAVGLLRVAGPVLAAVGALVVYAALTGALHFDAVADTFDALGTHSRADALRVMREPTIGAFGATALFLDLFLWTALVAALVGRPSFLEIVVGVGALSRVGPVLLLVALPYLRSDGGTGAALARGSTARAGVAVAIGLGLAWLVLEVPGLWLAGALLVGLGVLGLSFRRWLGGVTGDMLGCSVEILALLGLSTAVALLFFGVLR
jgi:adenosylcobinamide-GDP ribazoletransferase